MRDDERDRLLRRCAGRRPSLGWHLRMEARVGANINNRQSQEAYRADWAGAALP